MGIRHELLKRLRDPRGPRTDKGWAGRSLEDSIARALLIGMASLQGVMVLASLLSLGWQTAGLILAASHLVALGAALAVLRLGRGHLICILGCWALFVVDWAVSPTPDSFLVFAACWALNLTDALPAFLLRGKAAWLAPLGAVVAIPVAMVALHPDLITHPLVTGAFVTLIAITVATRIGLSYLMDFTDGVDAKARELEETTVSLTSQKSATHQAAEDARILHDTAINTLGAIASGGAAVQDLSAVRERCLADIAAIETLRSHPADGNATRSGLRDAIRPIGIRLRYTGLSDAEIAQVEALLPPRVIRIMGRAAAEAVQNAAKHSRSDSALVAINRTPEGLRVAVSDQGVGIENHLTGGTGIKRSILERAREVGVRAVIASAPGQGTTVTLDYAFNSNVDDAAPAALMQANAGQKDSNATDRVEDLVDQLRWRSVYALSAGLVGVGMALAALNHPGEATPEWLMVAVVGLACWLAWRERDRPRLLVRTVIVLMLAGPVAFLLSAWSVGFGLANPILWQAIGPTGPLLVLMIVSLPLKVKVLAFAAYLLTVFALAISVAAVSWEAGAIVALAGFLGLGLIMGVAGFVRRLAAVATRAHREQREAFKFSLELAAAEAAAEARRRLRDAGLDQSISLLRAVGEGNADPKDPVIRQRCAEEEAFLRQLSLLNPELIQMGTWFARALNASRLKGLGLTVRAGTTDAKADDAHQLGGTLLAVVDAMPPGTMLTTAFFTTARGLAMTLVAPTPHLISALRGDRQQLSILKLQTLGEQDFAELVVAG